MQLLPTTRYVHFVRKRNNPPNVTAGTYILLLQHVGYSHVVLLSQRGQLAHLLVLQLLDDRLLLGLGRVQQDVLLQSLVLLLLRVLGIVELLSYQVHFCLQHTKVILDNNNVPIVRLDWGICLREKQPMAH